MNEVCSDNRFEVIRIAKERLLAATNIDTSPDEMKVLDNFLFRCWQMGWLDRYEKKIKNNVPEINVGKWISCSERMPEDKCYGCFGAANNDCRFCGDDGK